MTPTPKSPAFLARVLALILGALAFAGAIAAPGPRALASEEKPPEGKEVEAGKKPEGEGDAKKNIGPPMYEIDDLIVNLAVAPGKRAAYLKIKMALELARESDIQKVDPLKARLIDTFQVYLRELRVEDLQGSVGIIRLRSELLQQVNAAVKPVEVRDLLFREVLVQ